MSIIYLPNVYSTYAVSKWNTIFKYTIFLALFAAAGAPAVFATVIIPLTSIYSSLQQNKLDLNIEVKFGYLRYTFLVIHNLFQPNLS